MKERKWLKYFEGKLSLPEKDKSKKRAWVVFQGKKWAIEYAKNLITIFEGMKLVTDKPDRQFAKHFESKELNNLIGVLQNARFDGWVYRQKRKLWDREQADILARQLTELDVDFDYPRLIKERKYREELIEKLRKKRGN